MRVHIAYHTQSVFALYRPGLGSATTTHVSEGQQLGPVVIAGDLNAHIGPRVWTTKSARSSGYRDDRQIFSTRPVPVGKIEGPKLYLLEFFN